MRNLKIGDRVRATGSEGRFYSADDSGVIAAKSDAGWWVDFDPSKTVKCLGENDRQWAVLGDELELVDDSGETA